MAEANTQGQQTPGRMAVARRRRTRSDVWEHYNRFTADDGSDKAECKHCNLVLSANTRNGTSTLRTHINICNSQQPAAAAAAAVGAAAAQQPVPAASEPAGGTPEAAAGEAETSRDLAQMIVLHGHDPSIVNDEYFRSFVRRLNPEYKLPSRYEIEEMCDAIFDEARMGLFSKIQQDSNNMRVCLALGRAKTVEGELLYTSCHFIDDGWNLQKFILDAMVVVPFLRYYGPLLGFHAVTLTCAADFIGNNILDHGILDKLYVMSRGLKDEVVQDRLKDWIEKNMHGTSPVSRKLACTTYMDDVLHSVARCFLLDQDFTIEMSSQVQELNLTRQERQKILSELGLDDLWAYKEHWYSCYCSFELLACSRTADDAESFAQLLRKLWGEICRAIQTIFTSSCPTSNLCLGELFKLREILQSELALAIGDHKGIYDEHSGFAYGRDVADVLKEASDNLDMAIQDSYLVWSIPLALDPRYKLRYIDFIFKRAFGSDAADNYITEVTRKIKQLYTYYVEDDDVVEMVDGSVDPLEQAWDDHLRREAKTELDRYLEDSVVSSTKEFDIMNWWKDNSWTYPMVAQMARDALAIPTCSKLCYEQIAQVRSMVRGYSKEEYSHFS